MTIPWSGVEHVNVARVFRKLRDQYIDWRYGAINLEAPVGKRGEQAAARLLRRKGLTVVAESESDRGGEIDLIAIDDRKKVIIFVEVKTLATTKPGHPADRVDENKQRRVTRAALRYLKRKKLLGIAARFDVVAVWWPKDHEQPEKIQHYESAFDAAGDFQMY
ncbi:YraN family protein [Planctomycetes bacterium K23_9]|uniref:YraN family protein n=1 Tax=Stieleria marina TaxID=1930275 RepID=UPI0011A07A1D